MKVLKARVIVTQDCLRNCGYCCNEVPGIREQMRPLDDIGKLAQYDELNITGGEPMLYPTVVMAFARALRKQRPEGQLLYLYTAMYVPYESEEVLPLVDGVQYTLHDNANAYDIQAFRKFQTALRVNKGSYRLRIGPDVSSSVTISPWLWSRVTCEAWVLGEELTERQQRVRGRNHLYNFDMLKWHANKSKG